MENPPEKKPFPWVWVVVGCGVVAVGALALAAVLVFALVFLPAFRTELARQSQGLNALPTLPSNAAPALPTLPPNQAPVLPTPGGGTTLGSLPFKFGPITNPTTQASQSLMDQMVTTLNLNSDTDFFAPKTYKGTASLDPSSPFTLGDGWCAKDAATLQQNLADMQFTLSIDGTNVDLSQYPTLSFTDNRGYACAMTGIAITPDANVNGSYHMVLTQKFLRQLDDGITSSPYPAGDVTFDFTIQFSPAPNS